MYRKFPTFLPYTKMIDIYLLGIKERLQLGEVLDRSLKILQGSFIVYHKEVYL